MLQSMPRDVSIQSSSIIDFQCVNWGHIIDGIPLQRLLDSTISVPIGWCGVVHVSEHDC
jgi:hypothetical protein